MNIKLPPGVNPPPVRSVESALTYKVSGVPKYLPYDDYHAMAAHIERQRLLIEARRRAMQAGEGNFLAKRVNYVNFVKIFYTSPEMWRVRFGETLVRLSEQMFIKHSVSTLAETTVSTSTS
jgi:hypothetical protein